MDSYREIELDTWRRRFDREPPPRRPSLMGVIVLGLLLLVVIAIDW